MSNEFDNVPNLFDAVPNLFDAVPNSFDNVPNVQVKYNWVKRVISIVMRNWRRINDTD